MDENRDVHKITLATTKLFQGLLLWKVMSLITLQTNLSLPEYFRTLLCAQEVMH